MQKLMCAAAVIASSFGTAANAAVIDFGTSGGSNCSASGCSVNLGGSTVNVSVSSGQGSVTQALFGLGVDSGFADDGALDNYAVGASQEALTFTFDAPVVLDSIGLGLFEGPDSGNSFYTIDGGSQVPIHSSSFTVGQQVSTLVISTDPRGFIGNTTFRVNQLEVSAVPLPAAAWLFGSALFGLGFVKRRRNIA